MTNDDDDLAQLRRLAEDPDAYMAEPPITLEQLIARLSALDVRLSEIDAALARLASDRTQLAYEVLLCQRAVAYLARIA